MNYIKYMRTVGFKQKVKADPCADWNDSDLPNKDRVLILKYIPIEKETNSEFRHILSWEYKMTDSVSIWVNTYKMTQYRAWLCDKSAKDKYTMLQPLICGAYNSYMGAVDGHFLKHILSRLPEKYQYLTAAVNRQSVLDRLFK